MTFLGKIGPSQNYCLHLLVKDNGTSSDVADVKENETHDKKNGDLVVNKVSVNYKILGSNLSNNKNIR